MAVPTGLCALVGEPCAAWLSAAANAEASRLREYDDLDGACFGGAERRSQRMNSFGETTPRSTPLLFLKGGVAQVNSLFPDSSALASAVSPLRGQEEEPPDGLCVCFAQEVCA